MGDSARFNDSIILQIFLEFIKNLLDQEKSIPGGGGDFL